MTVSVVGIGWLTKEGYGCIRSGLQRTFAAGEDQSTLPKKGLFSHPFKNFGRMDAVSKTTAYAVACALQDAGIRLCAGPQTGHRPGRYLQGRVARTDREYFRDYIDGGRTLSARKPFHLYAAVESARRIGHPFRAAGSAALRCDRRPFAAVAVLELGASIVAGREASMMLAGLSEEDEAVFFVLGSGDGATPLCSVTEALATSGAAAVRRGDRSEVSELG